MVFFRRHRGSHFHRWIVDAKTGTVFCMCGVEKTKLIGERKFHNRGSIHDGISYHSEFEANYARELDLRKRAGDIKDWRRQVKLDLRVNGQHITNYYIDFVVEHTDGRREFVECKGYETPEWTLKWRILEATFDDHKEGPDDFMTLVKLGRR